MSPKSQSEISAVPQWREARKAKSGRNALRTFGGVVSFNCYRVPQENYYVLAGKTDVPRPRSWRALTRVGTDSLVRGTPVLRSSRESIGSEECRSRPHGMDGLCFVPVSAV